ncbi:cysteine hydrolase family protein [Halobellus sp. EA9]|uniref:cysteine hydrolase family protein n=1 Tax=Halobellus sp. EA9 TaxID=3421647 RepID=UPI003EBEFD74
MVPTDAGAVGDTPALLVIDPQRDALSADGALGSPATSTDGLDAVIENINTVVDAARESDVPVLWTREVHRPDLADYGAELLSSEPEHGLAGESSSEFHDDIDADVDELGPAEYLITKRRYNCFHNTELDHLLDTFDVDTLVLTGVLTNVCVHYTAHGAHERDYAFRTVEECTAAPSEELHESALRFMRYLQPDGVPSIDTVLDGFDAYAGNPIVERVKREGRVAPGPVHSMSEPAEPPQTDD